MAFSSHRREARHVDSLASKGIPTLLEVEVSAVRQAANSTRRSKIDCRDGFQQSDMGRGTDRKRTFVEDRNSDFAAHCWPVYAAWSSSAQGPVSAVDEFRTQSCESHYRR